MNVGIVKVTKFKLPNVNALNHCEQQKYLREFVGDNELLPDSHRLPCGQRFKQHLLFDLVRMLCMIGN